MEITLKVERKGETTILSNGKGSKWTMEHVDDETAIASLVFFTLKHRFDQLRDVSGNFEIKITMTDKLNKE